MKCLIVRLDREEVQQSGLHTKSTRFFFFKPQLINNAYILHSFTTLVVNFHKFFKKLYYWDKQRKNTLNIIQLCITLRVLFCFRWNLVKVKTPAHSFVANTAIQFLNMYKPFEHILEAMMEAMKRSDFEERTIEKEMFCENNNLKTGKTRALGVQTFLK